MVGQVAAASVAGATATTLGSSAFAGFTAADLVGRTVVVQSGAGTGQGRKIVAFDDATDTATLDKPWIRSRSPATASRSAASGEYHGLAIPNDRRAPDRLRRGRRRHHAAGQPPGHRGRDSRLPRAADAPAARRPDRDGHAHADRRPDSTIVGPTTLTFTDGGPLFYDVTVRADRRRAASRASTSPTSCTRSAATTRSAAPRPRRLRLDELVVAQPSRSTTCAATPSASSPAPAPASGADPLQQREHGCSSRRTGTSSRTATSAYVIQGYRAPAASTDVTGRVTVGLTPIDPVAELDAAGWPLRRDVRIVAGAGAGREPHDRGQHREHDHRSTGRRRPARRDQRVLRRRPRRAS